MIETNRNSVEISWSEQGRQLLDAGNIVEAVKSYQKAHDPESLDEREARNMLIEARAHLSRKHFLEALESFEEALVMGTEIQRNQAIEGIVLVAEARARLPRLASELKKGLRDRFGRKDMASYGLASAPEEENIVLVSEDAIESLPEALKKGSRIGRLPGRLSDLSVPIRARRGIAYSDREDVRYILQVAEALKESSRVTKSSPSHSEGPFSST
jgi:tetratricopeptide (TPR) repeat protein